MNPALSPDTFGSNCVLVLVIVFTSIIQSVFGVGLLVFGTPMLLLLGYSFEATLSVLLPCSIVVSFVQTLHGRGDIRELKRDIPIYILPFVFIGLVFILVSGTVFNIRLLVGIMMVLIGVTRIFGGLERRVRGFISKRVRSGLVITGLIHGATNLGGGPLTIMMNAVYTNKAAVRANIAYGYLLMALTQAAVLFLTGRGEADVFTAVLPAISLATYLVVGKRIFRCSSHAAYHHLMTLLIVLFGFCLIGF